MWVCVRVCVVFLFLSPLFALLPAWVQKCSTDPLTEGCRSNGCTSISCSFTGCLFGKHSLTVFFFFGSLLTQKLDFESRLRRQGALFGTLLCSAESVGMLHINSSAASRVVRNVGADRGHAAFCFAVKIEKKEAGSRKQKSFDGDADGKHTLGTAECFCYTHELHDRSLQSGVSASLSG